MMSDESAGAGHQDSTTVFHNSVALRLHRNLEELFPHTVMRRLVGRAETQGQIFADRLESRAGQDAPAIDHGLRASVGGTYRLGGQALELAPGGRDRKDVGFPRAVR